MSSVFLWLLLCFLKDLKLFVLQLTTEDNLRAYLSIIGTQRKSVCQSKIIYTCICADDVSAGSLS